VSEHVLRQKIESRLLEAVRSAHDRYYAGECDGAEYETALKSLTEFLVDGKWPDYLKPDERVTPRDVGTSGSADGRVGDKWKKDVA
jgi:hypothetical protein